MRCVNVIADYSLMSLFSQYTEYGRDISMTVQRALEVTNAVDNVSNWHEAPVQIAFFALTRSCIAECSRNVPASFAQELIKLRIVLMNY